MIFFFQAIDQTNGKETKTFQCVACGNNIAEPASLLLLEGINRHVCVNPQGVVCDFHTFYDCAGAIALGESTEEYTWFADYAWRMAFCNQCALHLGWHYEGITGAERPRTFWGILVDRLVMSEDAEPT